MANMHSRTNRESSLLAANIWGRRKRFYAPEPIDRPWMDESFWLEERRTAARAFADVVRTAALVPAGPGMYWPDGRELLTGSNMQLTRPGAYIVGGGHDGIMVRVSDVVDGVAGEVAGALLYQCALVLQRTSLDPVCIGIQFCGEAHGICVLDVANVVTGIGRAAHLARRRGEPTIYDPFLQVPIATDDILTTIITGKAPHPLGAVRAEATGNLVAK